MRSTAFQPCITLGGLHWDEMGQKHDLLKKNALKTAFWGDTILDRLTSEGVGTAKVGSSRKIGDVTKKNTGLFFLKYKNKLFKQN